MVLDHKKLLNRYFLIHPKNGENSRDGRNRPGNAGLTPLVYYKTNYASIYNAISKRIFTGLTNKYNFIEKPCILSLFRRL